MDKRLPKLSKEEKRKRKNESQVRYTKTTYGRLAKREQNRRWRKRNKEHIYKYYKKWMKKNPDYHRYYRITEKRGKE